MSKRILGLLAACVAVAGTAQAQTTLRVVNHSDLKILDPIWTTAYIVRNHGYMIYDTLFALDGNLEVKPQMVDKWTTSDDKLTWTFTLRDGLEFHDGTPVTADDVVPSLKRWAVRDPAGPDAVDQGRRRQGARSQDLPDPAQGADRHHAAGAGQALGQRLHHAQEGRRDRSLQADRRLHRLRSLHLREGRVEARRQDGLRQEPQVQAARPSRPPAWPAARSPRSIGSNGWRCPTSRRR